MWWFQATENSRTREDSKVCCQMKVSRRHTPLGGGQNDTYIMRIIFCVECAELSMRLHLMKTWNLMNQTSAHAYMKAGLRRPTNQLASSKALHHIFMFLFLVAQVSCFQQFSLLQRSAAHFESLIVQTCFCSQEKHPITPYGTQGIFDWHKYWHIFEQSKFGYQAGPKGHLYKCKTTCIDPLTKQSGIHTGKDWLCLRSR